MGNTIFYSWQSDRPKNRCRNVIERALKDAIRRIAVDVQVEVAIRDGLELDRDTKNVPGSPPVFDTILEKIARSSVFVPDLTFVGNRSNGKPTPNPNVLIEYGYALSRPGHSRIVAVMNRAYGPPTTEDMPFDLVHRRFPITYALPEDTTDEARRSAREALSKELETALRAIFTSPDFSAAAHAIERPRTSLDEASDYSEDLRYQDARAALTSGAGLQKVIGNVRELFALIEGKCRAITSRGEIEIDVGSKFNEPDMYQNCAMTAEQVGMQITWFQRYRGSNHGANLTVRTFNGTLILPNETRMLVHIRPPKETGSTIYLPELSRKLQVGWLRQNSRVVGEQFYSSEELADYCVRDFIRILRNRLPSR